MIIFTLVIRRCRKYMTLILKSTGENNYGWMIWQKGKDFIGQVKTR